MKKIDLSNIVDGVRKLGAVKQIFEHMEQGYVGALSDLLYGLLASSNGPTALYGCVNSGSGSTYTISAGAIFHNGEVYTIPAFSGLAPGVQVPVLSLVNTITQLAYTDNTNQNTLQTRTYAWSFGASGSGLADFSAVTTLKNRINSNLLDVPGQVTAAVNAVIAAAPGALDTLDELAAALGDDANFASNVTSSLAGKVAKAGDIISGSLEVTGGVRTLNSGPYLLKKVVDIGDWNMDAVTSVDVSHGLGNFKKIRSIQVIVRNDADSVYYSLYANSGTGQSSGCVAAIDGSAGKITLERTPTGSGGIFDNTSFDSTSYNRGWIFIEYEA